MTDIHFDTLKVTQDLRDAGFHDAQAEAITGAIRAGVTGGVATKADIAEIKADLKWIKAIGGVLVAVLLGVLWLLIERLPPGA